MVFNSLSTLPWGFQCVLACKRIPTSHKSVLISCWLTRSELAQSGWNLAGHERAHSRSRCHHLQFGCLLEIQIFVQCFQPGFESLCNLSWFFGDITFQFGWRQNLGQWSIQLWFNDDLCLAVGSATQRRKRFSQCIALIAKVQIGCNRGNCVQSDLLLPNHLGLSLAQLTIEKNIKKTFSAGHHSNAFDSIQYLPSSLSVCLFIHDLRPWMLAARVSFGLWHCIFFKTLVLRSCKVDKPELHAWCM